MSSLKFLPGNMPKITMKRNFDIRKLDMGKLRQKKERMEEGPCMNEFNTLLQCVKGVKEDNELCKGLMDELTVCMEQIKVVKNHKSSFNYHLLKVARSTAIRG